MNRQATFDECGLERVGRRLRVAVTKGEIPGGVIAVGRGSRTVLHVAAGRLRTGPGGQPVRPETPFDLASLTKVVATTPAVLALAAGRRLRLDDRVVSLLPGFAEGDERAKITVEMLLTHTSGLPAHRDFHRRLSGPDLLAAVRSEPLESRPGAVVRYSDLGFLLLGDIVAAVTGRPLEMAVRDLVFDPLGLYATGYRPPAEILEQAAATAEPRDAGESCPPTGTVHDQNAAALGGVAGHAGLFGNAVDLARYLAAWVESGAIASAVLRRSALRCHTCGRGGHRGLGWVARGDAYDHLGARWPAGAVGHTGFTGTSLALDPGSGVWTVLLTNAVHLGRGRSPITTLRREIHDAVAAAVTLPGW